MGAYSEERMLPSGYTGLRCQDSIAYNENIMGYYNYYVEGRFVNGVTSCPNVGLPI